MIEVSKQQFEAFVANQSTLSETEIEQDGEFSYENTMNMDGETIAFVTYRHGDIVSYHIAN